MSTGYLNPNQKLVPMEFHETLAATFLRRIVIRRANGQLVTINIGSPCAAFKICYRPESCGTKEPFCLIEPDLLPRNGFCPACP